MDGTHCGEEHLDYYLLWSVQTLLPLVVQQGSSAVYHKGVPGQESLPHPQGRRGYLGYLSSFKNFGQATSFSYNAFSVQSQVVLQGAVKDDLFESFLGLFFSGELVYPLGDQKGGLSSTFSHLRTCPEHLCTSTAHSHRGTTSFFREKLQQGLIP